MTHQRTEYIVYVIEYVPGRGTEIMSLPTTRGYHRANVQRECFKLAYTAMQETGAHHGMTNPNPTTPGTIYKIELPNGIRLSFGVTSTDALQSMLKQAQKETN